MSYSKKKPNEKENEKLKSSLSCDFIDNTSSSNGTNNKTISPLNEFKPMDFERIDENRMLISKPSKTQRIKKLNLTSFNNPITNEPIIENTNESPTIIPSSMSASNMTQTYSTNEIVKTVKFKEPLEVSNYSSTADSDAKVRNKAEEQLLNALDETLLSANMRSSPSLSNSTNDDESLKADTVDKRIKYNRNEITNDQQQTIKASLSSNNMDKPPKPNILSFSSTNSPIATLANTTSSLTRTKFAQSKSRTIDFPDLLQGAMDSSNTSVVSNNKTSTSTSYLPSNTNIPPIKPIQSILRRSETPPNTKIPASTSFRQASIESTESSKERDRESSIEKKLRMTSSTSRPLMFNN